MATTLFSGHRLLRGALFALAGFAILTGVLVIWANTRSGADAIHCFMAEQFYEKKVSPVPEGAVTVLAKAETIPVKNRCDAADDPAIWVNPEESSKSLVLGTNKKGAINVYNLEGQLISSRKMSNPNNVDLRNDVMIGDRLRIIVAATLKKTSEIAVFELDPKSGELLDILETPIHTVPENETYGFCLYRNPDTKSLYAITTDKSGLIEQWLLFETENGKISGTKMRQLRVETQPEGCVADDINGKLFVGEEAVGVWKFDADPNGSKDKTLIAKVSDGAIAADVEGLALYVPPEQSAEAGYLIVSSQGSNSYALYSRSKPHTYRGSLQITYKGLMTGDTDGLDVTALSLGPNYPRGMLVVQDGLYKRPGQKERNQNFKFVSWKDIEDGLSLSPN